MLDPDTNVGYSYNKFKYTGTALTGEDRITYDARNLRNWREEEKEEEDSFRAEPRLKEEEGDSGASTPPLWSPPRTRNHQGANQTRTMSPNSRTQAIARGQRELMDMVSQMPEGCYELSLKDIVEHRPVPAVEARQDMTSNSKVVPRRDQKGTKTKKKKAAVVPRSRSGSFDNGGGMFLKVLFPVSFGSTKKKGSLRSNSKGSVGGGGCVDGRISPRPLLFGEGEGSSRYKDGDGGWWRKGVDDLKEDEEVGVGKESLGFSSSGKSGSSKSTGSSSRSSSMNSTRHSGFTCWSCIFRNKGKRVEA